jgi:hypothetical protein
MGILSEIFTKKGLKVLLCTFAVGFITGGITGIVGFCLVVDALAK